MAVPTPMSFAVHRSSAVSALGVPPFGESSDFDSLASVETLAFW